DPERKAARRKLSDAPVGPADERRVVTRIDVFEVSVRRIELGDEQRDETVGRSVIREVLIDGKDGLLERPLRRHWSVNCRVKTRQKESGRGAFPRHISESDKHFAVMPRDEVVIVAADLVAGERYSLEFVAVHRRRCRRLEALLDLSSELELVLHPLALKTLLEQLRVFDAYRRDGRQRCE